MCISIQTKRVLHIFPPEMMARINKLEKQLWIWMISTYVGRSPTSTITKTLLGAAFSIQYLLTNGSAGIQFSSKHCQWQMSNSYFISLYSINVDSYKCSGKLSLPSLQSGHQLWPQLSLLPVNRTFTLSDVAAIESILSMNSL